MKSKFPHSTKPAPTGNSRPRRSRFRPANLRMRVRTFDSFRYGRYLRLWFAMLCFSSGYWLQQIVVGWLTYDVTGSPMWTSLALGLDALPILLVGPIGGVLVDRFNRKRLIAFIYGYQATVSAIFAAIVLTGNLEIWHIFVYIPLMGVAIVINDPARMSLIANIVPKENLVNAFALKFPLLFPSQIDGSGLGRTCYCSGGPGNRPGDGSRTSAGRASRCDGTQRAENYPSNAAHENRIFGHCRRCAIHCQGSGIDWPVCPDSPAGPVGDAFDSGTDAGLCG